MHIINVYHTNKVISLVQTCTHSATPYVMHELNTCISSLLKKAKQATRSIRLLLNKFMPCLKEMAIIKSEHAYSSIYGYKAQDFVFFL
jgi:hypothetical protein